MQRVFAAAGPRGAGAVRVGAALRFAGLFAWQLLRANALLAREILMPQARLAAGVIGVRLPPTSDALTTLVANAISLTPGTLSLTIRQLDAGRVLYLHVLHPHDVDAVRRDLERLVTLAVRAFGSPSSPAEEGAESAGRRWM